VRDKQETSVYEVTGSLLDRRVRLITPIVMAASCVIGDEELWRWMTAGPREPTDWPSGGICTSLAEAKAAFQRAWDAHG
jgi:hypothetical protein